MKKIYPLLFKDNCTENSVALNGFLQDNTLDEIIETYLGNLLGDNVFSFFQGNFPISVEIKREMQRTPIKVSPNNDLSLQRYECWGKERMIYIISARKDSSMYIGFQKSLTATELYEKCQKGIILGAMNEIEPEEGETFYIRPGVPFSIGPGISYLELSQNSPVEFNIENMEQMVEALDFIKLEAAVPEYIAPEECLFRMERVAITKPQTIAPDQTESFMLVVNLDNQTSLKTRELQGPKENTPENWLLLENNDIALIPHDISELVIAPAQEGENPTSSFLRIYMSNIPAPPKDEEEEEEHGHDCGCGHDHDCGCGHDNGHDHDCGCDHDHDDHDCGCDHDHDDHDDHDCGCGHHHYN